ncbi:MAG: response regulator transcription factor [Candidatus Eremiobacterota bacterium]
MVKALLIDDDVELLGLLEIYFFRNSIEVSKATSGEEGLSMLEKETFDVVILDVMMPNMNGFEVLKKINAGYSYLPVIMLTAKNDEIDKIVGLEIGADDYIVKPFNSRELLARVRAVLRRKERFIRETGHKEKAAWQNSDTGSIEIDPEKRKTFVKGKQVELSSLEFDLLKIFVHHKGIVLSRERIMELARGQTTGFDRTLDVNISRLRQKIEKDPKNPEFIKTIWGVGYIYSGG